MHNLVKDIEGQTEEFGIDLKNWQEEVTEMENMKRVEIPGVKIRTHLDNWEREIPETTEEEIN